MTAQVYNVQGQNNAPYIPQGASPIITTNVPNINFQWGGGSVLGGPSEDVVVRFTGSIRSDATQNISFLATADDGTRLYIDGVLIADDWFDKGGGGTTSAPISFTAGVPKSIQLMYYENGGGANVFLYWNQSGSMQIIPASAFTSQAAPVVKTIGAPRNLTVLDNGSAAVLNWEAPNTGNTQPERYAISFNADGGGWGIATGNVGGANALNTTITISYSLLESLKPSGTTWTFSIRSDNDTNSLYSQISNQITIKIGKTQAEKDAEIAAANQSAANIVIASITNSNWSTARSQYDALTNAQKPLVNNYQALLDAEAAAALAIQQELDRQAAANTAVTNYENQPITTLSEVLVAEYLKSVSDTATAIVQNESFRLQLQSRIDEKTSDVMSVKTAIENARIQAEAAALLAAQQEAARLAAEEEAARLAALAAEAARLAAEEEAQRLADIAEQERLAELERQRLESIEAASIEAERIAALEAERLVVEAAAAAKAEAERLAAIEVERLKLAAEAEAKRIEQERIAAELKAKQEAEAKAAEEARLKAEAEAKAAEEARLKAEAEAKAKAEEEARLAEEARLKAEAEAKAKAEEDARLEAERIAAEEAKAKAEADAKAKAEAEAKKLAEQKAAEEARIKAEADKLKAEADAKKAEEERLKQIAEDAKKGIELSKEEVAAVVTALVENLKPGESISAAQVQASGVSYADLPPSTPIEVRTSESGEVLVITAEVAANVELVQDPGALLEAVFTDPGAALAAFGSIGADMTEGEREEATEMVVATVVAAGAAINAAAVAAGGSTGGTGGGGSSGGGSGANSPGSRGGRKW